MKPLQLIVAFVIAAIYMTPQPADAQFRKLREKVQQKVEEKVEQKVEEKVEQRAERALDAAIGNTVDGIADNLESSLQRMLFSDAPEPIELGPNETGSADAPYVRYTLASRIELGGPNNLASRLLRRFGAQQETVSTHGDKQRVDTGTESSQIIDAGNGKIIDINHEQRQWWSITLDEMMASLSELSSQTASSIENGESGASATASDEKSEGSVRLTEANISVDRTGKTETINGTRAAQVIMLVEGEYEISAPNEETGKEETVRGKSYAVYEVWQSTDVAGYNTISAYQVKAAEAMGAAMSGAGLPEMLAAMQSTPQLPEGTGEALSTLDAEDGLPIRTKLHLVQVAEDATLELEAVLNGSASSLEASSGDEPPSQFVLMTVITEIGDLTTTPFDAGHFEPPSAYTEISSPMQSATSQ